MTRRKIKQIVGTLIVVAIIAASISLATKLWALYGNSGTQDAVAVQEIEYLFNISDFDFYRVDARTIKIDNKQGATVQLSYPRDILTSWRVVEGNLMIPPIECTQFRLSTRSVNNYQVEFGNIEVLCN